jgi:hypothetical protein
MNQGREKDQAGFKTRLVSTPLLGLREEMNVRQAEYLAA